MWRRLDQGHVSVSQVMWRCLSVNVSVSCWEWGKYGAGRNACEFG